MFYHKNGAAFKKQIKRLLKVFWPTVFFIFMPVGCVTSLSSRQISALEFSEELSSTPSVQTPAPLNSIKKSLLPLLDQIEGLCRSSAHSQHKSLKNLINQINKKVSFYLNSGRLSTEDHIFLLEVKSLLLDIFAFPPVLKITQKTKAQMSTLFWHNYQTAYNLENSPQPVFHHSWAFRVYKGLQCTEN